MDLCDLDTLVLDADTANAAMTLNIVSGGSLTTTGAVTVTGRQSGAATMRAKVSVANGTTFAPYWLDLNGGDADARKVYLDFDETVTVDSGDAHAAPDTVAEGYVDIDVVSPKIFYPKDMKVDASAAYAQIDQSGTGEVEPTSLTISAGNAAGEHAFYQLSAGTLDVHGEVELNGARPSVDATAELQVDSGTIFTPGGLDLNGGEAANRAAVLDFDASVTVTAAGTDTSVDGIVDVELAAGVDFTAQDLTIVDAATSFKVSGPNSGAIAELIMDSFTNSLSGEIIYENNLQVSVQ